MQATNSEKLNPLTSLRFVAAMMIVVYHAQSLLPWLDIAWLPRAVIQGVSFFFVLSGFILTETYIKRPNVTYRAFMRSRLAKLWPLHVASLLALIICFPGGILNAVAQALSWRPLVYLGEASFALYLIHAIALKATTAYLGSKAPPLLAVLSIIVVIAIFAYELVEKPAQRAINSLRLWRPAAAVGQASRQ